jgi:hypothetical protein
LGQDAGSLLINTQFANCPIWNDIDFNPNNVLALDGGNVPNDGGTVAATNPSTGANMVTTNVGTLTAGQSAVLIAGATGPNPGALTFTWSQLSVTPTGAGTLGFSNGGLGVIDPNSNDAGTQNQDVVTCPPGAPQATYTIQLVVSDGPLTGIESCPANLTTGTIQVTCLSAAPCGGQPLSATAGGTCDVNSGSGPTAGDPAAAVGGYPYVASSTVDPGGSGFYCCSLACGGGSTPGETIASTYPSGTGGCAAGSSNNGAGCCLSLAPCTTAGQTNCVTCSGSTGGLCSPTEALIVQYDITNGLATASGAEPSTACYACLETNGCLDDTVGDTGHECGDLSGNFTNGATTPVTGLASTTCINTLTCVLDSTSTTAGDMVSQFQVGGLPATPAGCQSTSDGLTYCFCGPSGGSASACAAAGVTANGACFSQMALGFSHNAVTDTTDIIGKDFNNTTEPSGMANQILLCGATASHCPMCLSH